MAKIRKLNNTDFVVGFVIQGLQFGYRQCCIGEFVIRYINNTYTDRGERKFRGTGFVPCIKCNELSEEEIINDIEKNRQVRESFRGVIKQTRLTMKRYKKHKKAV